MAEEKRIPEKIGRNLWNNKQRRKDENRPRKGRKTKN